jgi:glycosyltransferase involved in cell wall biosynthesis
MKDDKGMQKQEKPPKLSIITTSLNQGRFIRQMIESVLRQSFTDYEHIVVDGVSTDDTLDILREYPHIRCISEKDGGANEAFIKAAKLAKGEYIIQCCTSDGFLFDDWFKTCVDVLDNDREVSLVWSLPQYMSEEGYLRNVSTPEFLEEPPPQKQEFLAYWLCTGHNMYEGNHCVRREVFNACFPMDLGKCLFRDNIYIDYTYNFVTRGYLPYFVPLVANFGRTHHDARGQIHKARERAMYKEYMKKIGEYWKRLLRGEEEHCFRDGASQVIGVVSKSELRGLKRRMRKTRLRIAMNRSIYQYVQFALKRAGFNGVREWLGSW